MIDSVLAETKNPPKDEPKGAMQFRKYFPSEYSHKQIDAVIIELLKKYYIKPD